VSEWAWAEEVAEAAVVSALRSVLVSEWVLELGRCLE
jgi:hypothetical protein